MGRVQEIHVPLPHPALADSDWADAWRVVVPSRFKNAREAAKVIVSAFPQWTYPALLLRQLLVAPFGLKRGSSNEPKADVIGIFPVTNESRDRLVAGFDDKHLDFRIIVDLDDTDQGQAVTLTTAIRRHNRLGQAYLQLVLPFHRAIIRSALANIKS